MTNGVSSLAVTQRIREALEVCCFSYCPYCINLILSACLQSLVISQWWILANAALAGKLIVVQLDRFHISSLNQVML